MPYNPETEEFDEDYDPAEDAAAAAEAVPPPVLSVPSRELPSSVTTRIDPSKLSDQEILRQKFNDPEYLRLKDSENQSRFGAQLGEAFDTIAHGVSGSKKPMDNSFYQNVANNADRDVKQHLDNKKLLQSYYAQQAGAAHQQKMEGIASDRNRINEEGKNATLEANNLNRKEQRDMKKSQDQAKARSELTSRIERSKSTGVVKNALESERLVDNLQGLFNEYPDLDKMPREQVALAVHELSKIASGGVGTEGSNEMLMPKSGMSKFQAALSYVANNPEPAKVGAFLKQNEGYLRTLKNNAKNVFAQAIRGHLTGYKNRVAPEDLEDVKSQYSSYLDNAQQGAGMAGANPPGGGPTVSKPAQVDQNDWDIATTAEKTALAKHFSKTATAKR